MRPLGIVRRVDILGRVVIPKELRTSLDIAERDPVEIFVEDEKIILKKYNPTCIFCGSTKNVIIYKDKLVCDDCAKAISEGYNG